MSTELTGDAALGLAIMTDVQQQLDAARPDEAQLDLLEPVTPEDIWDAREALGADATPNDVTKAARARKRGRPAGARNRRTDDLERLLLAHGQHPAVTLMQIQSTAPEVLMEASKRTKVHSFRKDGTANVVVEHMTYEAAQSLRARCADMLMPFLVGKKPILIDHSFSGVADLFIEGVTHSAREIGDILDAEFLPVDGAEHGDDVNGSDR